MHTHNPHKYNIHTIHREHTCTHTTKTTNTHNGYTLIKHVSTHAHMYTHNVHMYNTHKQTIHTHTTNFKYFFNLLSAFQFSKVRL